MATTSLPSTMRIWRYSSTVGGVEKNLHLDTSTPLPQPKPTQHLLRVLAVGLNPVDFKPAEAPVIGRFAISKPATPGFDVCGRIVAPADGSDLQPGTLVFGAASTNPLAGGALVEYVAVPRETVCVLPEDASPLDFAGAPVAAMTAYGSLIPHLRAGSRVFINGGSGGVGTYGIQLAKQAGAHVTVSCSARNAELCRRLGADEVLDYNAGPLVKQLQRAARASGHPFDHVVDNVFSDPALYWQAHTYTSPEAKFAEVAGSPTLAFVRFALGAVLLPRFLGGGRRKCVFVVADVKREGLEKIRESMVAGRVQATTDQVFPFEQAVEAFQKLKTGRARGKIIVSVAGKE